MAIACLLERENYELSEFDGTLIQVASAPADQIPLLWRQRDKCLPKSPCRVHWEQIPPCGADSKRNRCRQCGTENALSRRGAGQGLVFVLLPREWVKDRSCCPGRGHMRYGIEGRRSGRCAAAGRAYCARLLETARPWPCPQEPRSVVSAHTNAPFRTLQGTLMKRLLKFRPVTHNSARIRKYH